MAQKFRKGQLVVVTRDIAGCGGPPSIPKGNTAKFSNYSKGSGLYVYKSKEAERFDNETYIGDVSIRLPIAAEKKNWK